MNDAVRTMRAMRASSPDPVSLTSQSIPVPDPEPGELLVEVRGTAITAGELSWPESWPAIPCQTCPEWWRRPVTGPGTGDPATRSTASSASTAPAPQPSASPPPPPI
jgi:hypothetical protein